MSRLGRTLAVVATLATAIGVAAAAVTLNGAGATFPQPLYNKWFYEYNRANPSVRINYQGIGSGGGIRAIQSGTVDFGGSDAPLSDAELKGFPGKLLQIPTAGGSVALAYNVPGLKGTLKLNASMLAGIFLGYVTNWSDGRLKAINPGVTLPNRPITVCHRSDGSGTTFLFTSYLSAISQPWKARVGAGKSVNWPVGKGGKGNPGVAGLIRNIPGSIGYVELTYALQNKLPVAVLQNRSGKYIAPTLASTTACINGALSSLKADLRNPIINASGTDVYPIAGLTFILVYQRQKDAAKGQVLVNLLKWMMGTGQKLAPSLQYAPLPADLVRICLQKIGSIQVPR